MPWSRMRFKGEPVWVRVDDAGRPVLDGDGRAEMKYRTDDTRSYRPAPGNLLPLAGAEAAAAPVERPPPDLGPAVEVWTDGACSGNPGPMGIGVVVIAGGERREHGEYLGIGTNNIAELTAIERGLDLAEAIAPGQPVRVHSDSGYALGLLGKGWKAKANQELVTRLRRKLVGRPVTLVKVAGHAGIPENERCDALAREAIARSRAR